MPILYRMLTPQCLHCTVDDA